MKKLLVLGVWNTSPADSWQWFCPEMTDYFNKLTGFKIRFASIIENNLNKECFLYSHTEKSSTYF